MKSRPTRCAAVLVMVCLSALVLVAQQAKKLSPKDVAKTLAQADQLAAEGKSLEAQQLYLKLVQDNPADGAVALKLARVSESAGDWEGAIAAYQKAAASAQAGDQASAYAGLARAYVRNSKYEEASDSAKKALAIDPTLASTSADLAYSLLRMGSTEAALAEARKAVEMPASTSVAHAILGEALLTNGQAAEAERSFQKALELDPKSGAAVLGLAQVQYRTGDFEGAAVSASKALELDSSLKRAYIVRGAAYTALRKQSAAYSDLSTAILISTDDPDAHLAFGRLQRQQGNASVAAGSFRQAIALNPNALEAYVELAETLIGQGDFASAKEVVDQILQRGPQSARGHALAGRLLENEKQADAAVLEYGRAIELDANMADAYYRRGKILHTQKNDAAGAVASLSKAVDLKPDEPSYLTDLGVAAYDLKQVDQAVQALKKAVATPNYKNPIGFAVLGLALKDQQNCDEGLKWLAQAVELSPEWWLPHWGAAWCYFGQIKKGCPCGPEDEQRVAKMKEHVEKMLSLKKNDPVLEQRLDLMVKGQKIK